MAAILDDETLARFLDAHAPWAPLPRVEGASAWQAADELALWSALEEHAQTKLDPPFFCVAWPGAQVLALGLAERVVDVRGKSVLDVGCGSGVAACAAARLGAARVVANDVDPLAVRAASILAARHGVVVEPRVADVLAAPVVDADVILCADLIYSEAQRAPFARALARWKAEGREVLVADSGRPFFDPNGLVARRHIDVEVPRGVEGKTTRRATLYSF